MSHPGKSTSLFVAPSAAFFRNCIHHHEGNLQFLQGSVSLPGQNNHLEACHERQRATSWTRAAR
jgi:hypothetical protein